MPQRTWPKGGPAPAGVGRNVFLWTTDFQEEGHAQFSSQICQSVTPLPRPGVGSGGGGNKYMGQRKAPRYTELFPTHKGNLSVRGKSVLKQGAP